MFPCFLSPPFLGGDPEDRERGGYEGRRRAKRSALLRAGAGGGRELKRASGSEAAGNLQALRLHEIKALRPPSCPFPCPPSASHAPSAALPAFAAQAFAHGADGARPPVERAGHACFQAAIELNGLTAATCALVAAVKAPQ